MIDIPTLAPVDGQEPYTILLSMKGPDGSTRFVDQVVHDPPPDQRFLFFSWRTAIFAKYDVFHVHWPEWMVRSDRPMVTTAYRILFVLLLIRLKFTSAAVVRTIHNIEPHEPGGKAEKVLLRLLDQLTDEWIVLNPFTTDRSSTLIRHGDYSRRFEDIPKNETILGRIVFFGRIDRYKNVLLLVDAFTGMGEQRTSLRIVGRPTPGMRQVLENKVKSHESVSTRLEFVSDEELVSEVTSGQLVALPYSEMHNSGVIFVALSLARPVLVPDCEMSRWIQAEVGAQWVITYDELQPNVLQDALAATVHLIDSNERPSLEKRDWQQVSVAHAEVYRRNLDRRAQ